MTLSGTHTQKELPLKMNGDIEQRVYMIDSAEIFTVIFSTFFILYCKACEFEFKEITRQGEDVMWIKHWEGVCETLTVL